MLSFIEKMAGLFITQEERSLQLRELKVEFVRNSRSILHHLRLCRKSGGIVGLYSTRLGQGMFLATVSGIHGDIVSLKPVNDPEFVGSVNVPLNEITCICPFNQIYSEGVHENTEEHEYAGSMKVLHAN